MDDKGLQQPGFTGSQNQSPIGPQSTGGFAYQSSSPSVSSQGLIGQQFGSSAAPTPGTTVAPQASSSGVTATPTTTDIAPPTASVAEPVGAPLPQAPSSAGLAETLSGSITSSASTPPPETPSPQSDVAGAPHRPKLGRLRVVLTVLVAMLLLALLAPVGYLFYSSSQSQGGSADSQVRNDYTVTSIPLSDLVKDGEISFDATRRVNINGQLRINNSFVLTPSDTPDNPLIGQFYLNQQNTTLYYYNGQAFVDLVTGTQLAELTTTVNQAQALATQAAAAGTELPQDLSVTATPTFGGLNLSQPLGVASGGTGATTADAARTNLGAAASGANADITSLNALTAINPVSGLSYQFDTAVLPGTYNVCTTAGNCAGVGGGVTTVGGTAGRIAKFSSSQGIVDSLLSEAGSTVTVNGGLEVTNGTIDLGNGVNLSAAAPDILSLDASLEVSESITSTQQVVSGANITAQNGLSGQARIGNVGPSNQAGIAFGSAGDAVIYRSAANTLRTDDSFIVQPGADTATAFQIQNAAGTSNLLVADTANTRIGIGTAGPNYTLDVNGDINTGSTYRINGTSICILSGCVPSAGSSAYIQNGTVAQDANFYLRSAAANQVTGILQGAVGQTADLIQLRNQLGNTVTSVGANGEAVFKTTANSATAFQIQNASSSPVLIADTVDSVIKIGTTGTATQAGTALFASSAEISGALRVGDATNNIQIDGVTKKLVFNGTARQNVRVSLVPEYAGATLTGDGSNNTGTMTTDFCSGSSRLSINTGVCGATDEHNYYSWIGSGGTTDYDVYVRWQVPSNFSAFENSTAINMQGWRSTASERVDLAMFQQDGTQCGSTTEINSSNTTWQTTSLSGDETACSVSANDVVTFRVRLTSGSSGYARAGAIQINYLSRF